MTIQFCDNCGNAMKKIKGQWLCPSCEPDKIESESNSGSTREAVILVCPVCGNQRPYCGAPDAALGEQRVKMGIARHLDHHDVNQIGNDLIEQVYESREIREIPVTICEETEHRKWDDYGLS